MFKFRRARAARLAVLASAVAAPGMAAADDSPGRQIFVEGAGGLPPCALCHVLADAGATGEIGPDLDQLRPDPAKIRAAVQDGVGVMPPFGEVLSGEAVDAVVEYVAKAVGG